MFEIFGSEKLPQFVITDEFKLRIIIINLIGNALKFTEHGSIVIRFSVQKDSQKDSQNNEYLEIEVEDTGQGISDDEKEKLFLPFEQTESGKQSKSGTGLGLSISQEYAKLLNGEITVTSSPGAGSVFKVRIRIEPGSEADMKTILSVKQVIGLKKGQNVPRILIAEDIKESRLLLSNLLKIVGFEVREAANGAEALEIFKEWKPDFIWMDIRMPVMDGLEATRLIKANKTGNETKIAALSAHVLGKERKKIFEAGCDDFAGKPFIENEIFEIMKKHLHVEYVYSDTLSKDEETEETAAITINLSSLDTEICDELYKAVNKTDANKISVIAERIKTKDPALAEALNVCAKNFDYKTIHNALEIKMEQEKYYDK